MKPSGIITLTTDFGLRDPYVAMMKGVILSINPSADLVDISHLIQPGALREAAAAIQETYPYFPEGTVHLAVVDPGVGSGRRIIAVSAAEHYFVGPDNGLFSYVLGGNPTAEVIQLTEYQYFLEHVTHTFHGREIFAPVAAHISLGVTLDRLGTAIQDPIIFDFPKPLEKDGVLYGQITRVDHFGNCITNIGKSVLDRFLQSSRPVIEVGPFRIRDLRLTYADEDGGQPLALINSSDLLEIAVNMGRASEYLEEDPQAIVGKTVTVRKG